MYTYVEALYPNNAGIYFLLFDRCRCCKHVVDSVIHFQCLLDLQDSPESYSGNGTMKHAPMSPDFAHSVPFNDAPVSLPTRREQALSVSSHAL